MLDSMAEFFPESVKYTQPQGGLFLWGTMPVGISADEVLKVAIEKNVAFVQGGPFHACGGGENTMRLNFSNATPENIILGISRLGEALHTVIGK